MLNIEVARAQVGLSRANEFPTVDLQGTHTRETGIQTINTVGLAVAGYELDLWGRVRSLTDAALAQLSATEEARKAAQISLIASVANAYYAMAGDQALLDVATQTLADAHRHAQAGAAALRQRRRRPSIDLQLNKSLVETARVAFVAGAAPARARPERARAADRRPAAGAAAAPRRPGTTWRCPTCPPACRRTCCWRAPTCARPSSS